MAGEGTESQENFMSSEDLKKFLEDLDKGEESTSPRNVGEARERAVNAKVKAAPGPNAEGSQAVKKGAANIAKEQRPPLGKPNPQHKR